MGVLLQTAATWVFDKNVSLLAGWPMETYEGV